MKSLPLRLASLSCLLAACASGIGPGSLPERIVTERGGFIPEGIEYDTLNNRFLTGSLADGTIYEISSSGRLTAVIVDSELMASVGIEVDEPRNRLLVANSDRSSQTGAAMLGAYDMSDGSQLAMVNLADSIPGRAADSQHFANDVAVSTAGVAYVTDSRQKLVYKVDPYYKASVLIQFPEDLPIGLNGIEFHPNGYLILVSPATGQLIKVPVDRPNRWAVVELDFPATGGDGLVWTAEGELASISNNSSAVMKYRSDDNWASARLVGMASFAGQATTGAVVGDDIYVVQPHFADQDPPVILRAEF